MNLIQPRTREIPVIHDNGRYFAGRYTEHWDGSIDATVFAPTVQLRAAVNELRPVPQQIGVLRPDDLVGLSERDRSALLKGVGGGAFNTVSGMYAVNFMKVFDATQLAMALLADTVKIAMYNNTIAAMSYYADVAQTAAPYNANEASGTGYTAGGYTLANKTITQSPNGTMMIDNTVDPNWSITGSFAAAVFGAVVHDTTISANGLICAIYFGSGTGYNVTNGTFTIQFNSLGIATLQFAA